MRTGNTRFFTIAASFAILLAVLCPRPAQATLGADESSLDAVKILISPKSEKVTSYATHRVHEYAVVRGVIRAYVSTEGKVFAYTGHNQMGHPPPAVFGPYLKEYEAAVRQFRHRGGRRPLSISTAHLRAGMSGPQGSLNWFVYLQELPTGVTRDDIR